MTELVEDETEEVAIVNVALLAVAGTTTLAGTCAAAVLELVSVTVAPPLSAGTTQRHGALGAVASRARWPDSPSPKPLWELPKSLASDSLFA